MAAMDWTRNGEAVALGWTLLHFCWQGTVVALLYAGIDRLTSAASVRVRYVLAVIALALMPSLVAATFWEQSHLVRSITFDGQQRMASGLSEMHGVLLTQIPMTRSVVETTELWLAGNADRVLPCIDGIWVGGVFLMAVRALGGWWRLEYIRKQARAIVPPEVEALFLQVKSQLRYQSQACAAHIGRCDFASGHGGLENDDPAAGLGGIAADTSAARGGVSSRAGTRKALGLSLQPGSDGRGMRVVLSPCGLVDQPPHTRAARGLLRRRCRAQLL